MKILGLTGCRKFCFTVLIYESITKSTIWRSVGNFSRPPRVHFNDIRAMDFLCEEKEKNVICYLVVVRINSGHISVF
jgi:hypothetical protein